MKNKHLQFLFAIFALVLTAAIEDILPKVIGVGIPVLLITTLCIAIKKPMTFVVIYAVAAGAAEDAISSLPMMTSVSFFVIAAILTRWAEMPIMMAALGYALYQFWLGVWLHDAVGNVFVSALAAIPVSLLTMLVVLPILNLLEKGAALNEEG